jgi:hypothetical protein
MNCKAKTGIGQTGKTCWFYSTLNTFLLSENLQKIMWLKLQEVYARLNTAQKAYFNSNVNAPCPLKNVKSTNVLYFWKFLDEYMCALGGPGRLPPKAGKSPELLKKINFRSESTKEAPRHAGGWPQKEIIPILRHLGFATTDFRIEDWWSNINSKWTQPFVVFVGSKRALRHDIGIDIDNMPLSTDGYELAAASLYINSTLNEKSNHRAHALACFICNGKGYIFDSNYPDKFWPCEWWEAKELYKFLNSSNAFKPYANFRNGKIEFANFSYIVYTKKDVTNKISPTCRMKYKPVHNINKARYASVTNDLFIGKNLKTYNNYLQNLNPALRTAIIRNWYAGKLARNMTRSLQYIMHRTTTANNALNTVKQFEKRGYTVNKNSNEYKIFLQNVNYRRRLHATTISRENLKKIVNNSNTKNAAKQKLANLLASGKHHPLTASANRMFTLALNAKFGKPMTLARAKSEVVKLKTPAARRNYRLSVNSKLSANNRQALNTYVQNLNSGAKKK